MAPPKPAWIRFFKRRVWTTKGEKNLLTGIAGSSVFALFVAGLYEYLSLRGIAISVFAARLVLVLMGLVATGGIFTSDYLWGNGVRHRKWWAIASATLVIVFLLGVDTWANALKAREALVNAKDYRRYGWVSFTASSTEDGQGDNGSLPQMQVWLGDTQARFKDVKLIASSQAVGGVPIKSDLTSGLRAFGSGLATLRYRVEPGTHSIETCLTAPSKGPEAPHTIVQDFKVVDLGRGLEIVTDGEPTVLGIGDDAARHAC